jgi:hypothetical protein
MASTTMTITVRVRRVWLLRLGLRLGARMVRARLPLPWCSAVMNAGVAAVRVHSRDQRGRRLGKPQPLTMRLGLGVDE